MTKGIGPMITLASNQPRPHDITLDQNNVYFTVDGISPLFNEGGVYQVSNKAARSFQFPRQVGSTGASRWTRPRYRRLSSAIM